jgi:hypothetical protein
VSRVAPRASVGATNPTRTQPIPISGEPFLRPGDAARILTDAGVSPLLAGDRLRSAARDGRVRRVEVHPRLALYAEADVRAEAERLGSAS